MEVNRQQVNGGYEPCNHSGVTKVMKLKFMVIAEWHKIHKHKHRERQYIVFLNCIMRLSCQRNDELLQK